jgi:hypothetical protein
MNVRTLSIEQVQPGMQLALPAKNQHGQILLAEGTVLEERHVRILKSWGVLEAGIADGGESAEAEQASDIPPDFLAKALAIEQPRFCKNDRQHPAIAEMLKIAQRHTAKRLWRESNAV